MIEVLTDRNGNRCTEETKFEHIVVDYFENLFRAETQSEEMLGRVLDQIEERIS